MSKKKNKILIFMCFIVVFIIILIILLLLLNNYMQQQNEIENVPEDQIATPITHEELKIVDNYSQYFTVSNCVQTYFNLLNYNSSSYFVKGEKNFERIITDEKINQNLIDILDKEYIQKNDITVQNLKNEVSFFNESVMSIILNMKVQTGDISNKYLVNGIIINSEYKQIGNYLLFVNLDLENHTFSIEPINNNVKFNDIIIENGNVQISSNENNIYQDSDSNYEKVAIEYIKHYKMLILSNPKIMYNYLDENYRNKKYGEYEEFKQFVEKNRDNILQTRLVKYKVENMNEKKQITCIDQKQKYYLFNEKSVLNYSLILDTYTIDLPEFTAKYEQSTNEEKVLMNIQKFFSAINDGDYKYAYNKLDATYRANNFKTQAEFEQYVKNTFFEQNKLSAGKVEKQGDIYLYKITISDVEEKSSKQVSKTFVMQLKEGTDFVMSFSK